MKVVERSVQEIGKSLLVTLPKGWADAVGVKKGTQLKLLVSDRGALSIMPEHVETERPRDATIPYDEHFPRRFFKVYFEGNEKITITTKGATTRDRKEIYLFLKRFMNLQIIEETAQRVVVKCFRIDDLTLEECLSRMHYLTLSLFESPGPEQAREIRDTMTRFYYMLVMQIRRYLSEGRFTDPKTVPLIRAMDYRMVAEKIQRIGETLAREKPGKDALVAKAYYARAFSSFINEDFEKALPLWKEGTRLAREKGTHAAIIRYAKEISMLVR